MATTNLRYPYNIDGSGDFIKFDFYDYRPALSGGASTAGSAAYNNSSSASKATKSELNSICITMPNDVGSNYTGNWGSKNLTGLSSAAFGAVAKGLDPNTYSSPQNLLSAITQGVTTAGSGFVEDALKGITEYITSKPGLGANLSTSDVLGLVGTNIINPNTELLYEGLNLREHGYNFKMIAFSKEEAIAIDDIVKTFKTAVLPNGKDQTFLGLTGRNFIGIPNVCQVSFYRSGGIENEYLPKYKLSAITGVNVDYITEGQYMTFDDGRPIGVNLRVTFKELKLIFRDEIESDLVR